MRRTPALLLLLVTASCAREVEPETPYAYASTQAPLLYPTWVSVAPNPPPPEPLTTPPPPRTSSLDIPDGEACLERLGALGVRYRKLDEKKGVATPIVVTGPIGGIRYYANGGVPLVCDCRLAVALHTVAPLLATHGVTGLRYSGAYSYRMTRLGRLSLHARGLAIDVHDLVVGGRTLSVERDYVRGLADGCAAGAPELDQIACSLRQTGLFKELLTPDYDADHHDHFHLAIAPLATPPGRD